MREVIEEEEMVEARVVEDLNNDLSDDSPI